MPTGDGSEITIKAYEYASKTTISLFENLYCADHPDAGFCKKPVFDIYMDIQNLLPSDAVDLLMKQIFVVEALGRSHLVPQCYWEAIETYHGKTNFTEEELREWEGAENFAIISHCITLGLLDREPHALSDCFKGAKKTFADIDKCAEEIILW